jgi:hypothetical protein
MGRLGYRQSGRSTIEAVGGLAKLFSGVDWATGRAVGPLSRQGRVRQSLLRGGLGYRQIGWSTVPELGGFAKLFSKVAWARGRAVGLLF